MKWILGFVAAFALIYVMQEPERAFDREAQGERLKAQSEILKKIATMDDPSAKEFAIDWAGSYPEPSNADLVKLQGLLQEIQTDPTKAQKMTIRHKSKHDPLCNGAIESPFGLDQDCKPG